MKFLRNNDTYAVVLDDGIINFNQDHPNFDRLVACLQDDDPKGLREAHTNSEVERIVQWSIGAFTYNNGVLSHKDFEIPECLMARVVEMIDDGFDVNPMLNFIERLMQNPSRRSVLETYTFLEHKCLSIDKDGYIIAYKGVTNDLKDCHTKSVDNSVGAAIPRFPRNMVDDDCNVGCSTGYHAGSKNYATGFGQRVMLVKIDPADVVSVPVDCSCQKLRCCFYEVIEEYDQRELKSVYQEVQDEFDNDDDMWDEDCDDDWDDEDYDDEDIPF